MRRLNQREKILVWAMVMAAVLAAVYALGLFLPEDAYASSLLDARQPPSWDHPFGTDALGRDLLARTLKGMALSMTVGLAASVVSAIIAVLVGVAAVGSRRVDAFFGWVIDLVMSVPQTIAVLLISFVLGRGLKGLLVSIAATHWCSLARLIRGEVLQLRGQPYIAVSRRLGKGTGWVIVNHLLPHLAPQFLVGLVLLFPHAVLHEASVSFLGYGLPPEQPAIGIILSESMRYLSAGMWWNAVLPGLVLVLTVLLVDRLGESLKTILDPYNTQQ